MDQLHGSRVKLIRLEHRGSQTLLPHRTISHTARTIQLPPVLHTALQDHHHHRRRRLARHRRQQPRNLQLLRPIKSFALQLDTNYLFFRYFK
jgi:hypothetical protein